MHKFITHLKVVLAFAGHLLAAALIFCLVGTGALLIQLFTGWLEGYGLDPLMLQGMHAIEWLYFGCDFLGTAAWTIMSTVRLIKELKE